MAVLALLLAALDPQLPPALGVGASPAYGPFAGSPASIALKGTCFALVVVAAVGFALRARRRPDRLLSPALVGRHAARVRVAQLPGGSVALRQLVLRGRRARARRLPRARGGGRRGDPRLPAGPHAAGGDRGARSASRASCTTASPRRSSTRLRRCAGCRRSSRGRRRIACWARPSVRSPSRAPRSRRCARRSTSRCRPRSRASGASWVAASSSTCTSRRTPTSTSSRPCATRSRGSSATRALSNAARHGHARCATIELQAGPPGRLRVRDDGEGFDVDPACVPDGAFGLQAMRERAAAGAGARRSARLPATAPRSR